MKNFDNWNDIKKKVDSYKPKKCHPKEIWWCFWGLNIGREESSMGEEFKRPVLVIKNFSKHTCAVLPLTTSKEINPNRIDLGLIGNKNAKAIISQIKVVDTRRLYEKICMLDNEKFLEIRKAVKNLF